MKALDAVVKDAWHSLLLQTEIESFTVRIPTEALSENGLNVCEALHPQTSGSSSRQ